MLLTEIDHVAIAVRDLEAAIDYYQRAFGAEVEHRETVESDGVEEALLKVAESYIQLLTPTTPDSPVAKAIEKRGEGLHHVGYRVADCKAALAAMVAAGATPIEGEQDNCARVIFDFLDAIKEGRPPIASGPSVLPAMRVLQAVQDDWDRQYGAQSIPGRPLERT